MWRNYRIAGQPRDEKNCRKFDFSCGTSREKFAFPVCRMHSEAVGGGILNFGLCVAGDTPTTFSTREHQEAIYEFDDQRSSPRSYPGLAQLRYGQAGPDRPAF
jgi:hypothetical protein